MGSSLLLMWLVAAQPDPAALRRLFEENLARRQDSAGRPRPRRLPPSAGRRHPRPRRLCRGAASGRSRTGTGGAPDPGRYGRNGRALPAGGSRGAVEARRAEFRRGRGGAGAGGARRFAGRRRRYGGSGEAVEPGAGARGEGRRQQLPVRVAVRLNALGPLLPPREGIPLLERALAINRKTLGDRHPRLAGVRQSRRPLLGRRSPGARCPRPREPSPHSKRRWAPTILASLLPPPCSPSAGAPRATACAPRNSTAARSPSTRRPTAPRTLEMEQVENRSAGIRRPARGGTRCRRSRAISTIRAARSLPMPGNFPQACSRPGGARSWG